MAEYSIDKFTYDSNTYILQDGELTSTVSELDSSTATAINSLQSADESQNARLDDIETSISLLDPSVDGDSILLMNRRLSELEKDTGVGLQYTNNNWTDSYTGDPLEDRISNLEQDTEKLADTIEAFNVDTTSGTATVVGNLDSGTSIEVSDEIIFTQNGQKVAEIDDTTFKVTKALVADSLEFGNWIWIPRASGNLSLKWIG